MRLNLEKPLAIFDIESTGINVGTDRIVEIAILKIEPDGTEDLLSMRFNPTIPIPKDITAIHGISDEDVRDCPTFAESAVKLSVFLEKCDLGGYNSNKFDIPILVEEFLRSNINFDLTGRRFIDVQNIFHQMEPRNLRAAYRFYCGKEIINAHSAEADAKATYEVLLAQIQKYDGVQLVDKNGNVSVPVRNNVQALHEFSSVTRNADLVGHIVFNEEGIEVFNFGKNKGKSVEEVFQREPSYYDWMMKADFPRSTKTVIEAIQLRRLNQKFNKSE